MNKNKVYIVVTHPIQYFVPLYQEMAKDADLDLHVMFCSDETIKGSSDEHFGIEVKWDIPLLEGYNFKFLKNNSWKPSLNNGFWGIINLSIISYLWSAPKGLIVVSGWKNFTYVLALFFGKLFGHKIAIRCEAPYFKEALRKPSLKNSIRKILLKYLLFKFIIDYFQYIGVQNKKFYEHFGVKPNQLLYTPYAVDNERFRQSSNSLSKSKLRENNNINENDFVVLFTGKLYDVKRPFDLINSFLNLDAKSNKLILVGDGILRSRIAEFVAQKNIKNIQFPGFKNQTEIPDFYKMADVLVLCSESETWGLSINEAMNFGLPIICTNTVGCADDLVKTDINGFVFEMGDVDRLCNALKILSVNPELRLQMGKASLEIVQDYSYHKTIQNIKKELAIS